MSETNPTPVQAASAVERCILTAAQKMARRMGCIFVPDPVRWSIFAAAIKDSPDAG